MRVRCYLIWLLFAVLFVGCDKNENSSDFNESLSLFNEKYNFINYSESRITPSLFGIKESINSKFLYVSEKDFNDILLKVKQKYGVEYNLDDVMISFYGKDLEINKNIDKATGISIISSGNSGIYQEIYQIKGNELERLDYFSKSYAFLLTQHFGYMTKSIDSKNNSFINIVKKDNNSKKYSSYKVNIEKFNILYPELKNVNIKQMMRVGHSCSDCNGNAGFCAWNDGARDVICESSSYIDDGGTEEGEEPICSGRETETQDESIQRMNSMYYIKYFILNDSPKGNEYIENYYKLGEFFHNKNLFVTKKQELTEIVDFIEDKAVLFVFSSGSTVIINNSDALYLQSKIDEYRLYENDVEYQNIFGTLESDLQLIKNKTKSDIINILSESN